MKLLKMWPLAVCCACFPISTAIGSWRVLPIRTQGEFEQGMTGGEAEQHLHSIARCLTHPNVIYLSQDVAGAWRSIDSGDTWKKCLDLGLYINNGQSIAVDPIDPNIVFLELDNAYNYQATQAEGLYRSTDAGDSWERVLATATNYTSSVGRSFRQAIACDLTSVADGMAQRWYVAFPENGIYRSEDGGLSFGTNPVSSLSGHKVVFRVLPVPGDDSKVFVATDLGLYFSSEQGANLAPIGDLPSGVVTSVEVDPRDRDTVYVAVRQKGLYRSTDGGAHFSLLKSFSVTRMFMNFGHPDTLYLIGSQKTIVTHDAGQTWTEDAVSVGHPETGNISTGNAMEVDGELAGLAPNPSDPNEAVGYAKASIWKTTDGGKIYIDSSTLFTGYAWSWWNRGAAFDRFNPERFAFFNNDVGMTITTTGGDYFERRNPQAWSWYQSGLIQWIGTYAGDFRPVEGSPRIVAAVGDYFRTQLMVTSNLGETWDLLVNYPDLESTLERNLFIGFHPNDPDFVYAGDKVSTDAGLSFEHIDFGDYASLDPYVMGFCEAQPDTVYAVSTNGRNILRSDDRGETWALYVALTWSMRPFDSKPTFVCDPADPDLIYTINSSGDLARFDGTNWTHFEILKLVDGGSAQDGYYNYVRTIAVDPSNSDVIYAGMFCSGTDNLFMSTDGGDNWVNISENMPRVGISSLAVNPHSGELFTGTLCGTWIRSAPYASDNPVFAKAEESPAILANLSPASYQAWRLQSFEFDDFIDDDVSGPDANPDNDNFNNLSEYAFAASPLEADEFDWAFQAEYQGSKTQYSIRSHRRSRDPNLFFDIEASTDLETWTLVFDHPDISKSGSTSWKINDDVSDVVENFEESNLPSAPRYFRIVPRLEP